MAIIAALADPVADRIDELTDLCELWKKRREEGRPATYLRRAIIDLSGEILAIIEMEQFPVKLDVVQEKRQTPLEFCQQYCGDLSPEQKEVVEAAEKNRSFRGVCRVAYCQDWCPLVVGPIPGINRECGVRPDGELCLPGATILYPRQR